MNGLTVLPSGSIPALVTPFGPDGRWSPDVLAALVEWHAEEGSAALVVAGTTGEGVTLDDDEHAALIAETARCARGRLPIIAGTGSNDTRRALELTRRAEAAGAAATLHATGYYNRPSQAQVVRHYAILAEAATRPIIVYDIPARTGLALDVATVVELAALPGIGGIKDSTGELGRLTAERLAIDTPFAFLSGDDFSALGYLASGGHGCVSVTANVAPGLCARMCAAAADGNIALARKFHEALYPLHRALFAAPSPSGVKYALSLLGRCDDVLRPPLTPVEPPVRQTIAAALRAIDIRLGAGT